MLFVHVVKSFEENQGKYKQTMLAIHVVRMVQRVNLCKWRGDWMDANVNGRDLKHGVYNWI